MIDTDILEDPTAVGLVFFNDILVNEPSDVDSEQYDDADEDSNAEDYYANDYPEEDDGDEDFYCSDDSDEDLSFEYNFDDEGTEITEYRCGPSDDEYYY